MITCEHLLQLDSFRGVRLIAGKQGLGNVISWPYAKHTKEITPWVKSGEFLMVSGFEVGVNEEELLRLMDEANVIHLSGILIEGGINFKELTKPIIEKADQISIPLFFTPNVVSFLDISRDISSMIVEAEVTAKLTTSLLGVFGNMKNTTFSALFTRSYLKRNYSASQIETLTRCSLLQGSYICGF